jgi:hypothetical protein
MAETARVCVSVFPPFSFLLFSPLLAFLLFLYLTNVHINFVIMMSFIFFTALFAFLFPLCGLP